jgi:hypothetical protein
MAVAFACMISLMASSTSSPAPPRSPRRPATQRSDRNPPVKGVHLNTPLEYLELQHPFAHWELFEHKAQSPSLEPVGAGGAGAGAVGGEATGAPPTHMSDLNPPVKGVHLSTPFEYAELQHPFVHWELVEHKAQSPSLEPVGVAGGEATGEATGAVGVPPVIAISAQLRKTSGKFGGMARS